MTFDLSHITLTQVVILTLVLTVIDFASGVLPAVVAGKFDPALVAQFLDTHVLKRAFPIVGLVVISETLGSTSTAGVAVWSLAMLGLAAYLTETASSLAGNLPITPAPAP